MCHVSIFDENLSGRGGARQVLDQALASLNISVWNGIVGFVHLFCIVLQYNICM